MNRKAQAGHRDDGSIVWVLLRQAISQQSDELRLSTGAPVFTWSYAGMDGGEMHRGSEFEFGNKRQGKRVSIAT